jgi:hypothetical protein
MCFCALPLDGCTSLCLPSYFLCLCLELSHVTHEMCLKGCAPQQPLHLKIQGLCIDALETVLSKLALFIRIACATKNLCSTSLQFIKIMLHTSMLLQPLPVMHMTSSCVCIAFPTKLFVLASTTCPSSNAAASIALHFYAAIKLHAPVNVQGGFATPVGEPVGEGRVIKLALCVVES